MSKDLGSYRGRNLSGVWFYGYKSDRNVITTISVLTDDHRYPGHRSHKRNKVQPESIGRHLFKHKGQDIYEGDILGINKDEYPDDSPVFMEIRSGELSVEVRRKGSTYFRPIGQVFLDLLVKVGNIHDNPEIMEGGDDE